MWSKYRQELATGRQFHRLLLRSSKIVWQFPAIWVIAMNHSLWCVWIKKRFCCCTETYPNRQLHNKKVVQLLSRSSFHLKCTKFFQFVIKYTAFVSREKNGADEIKCAYYRFSIKAFQYISRWRWWNCQSVEKSVWKYWRRYIKTRAIPIPYRLQSFETVYQIK